MLEKIINECSHYTKLGRVASYIPELQKANPDNFGICVIDKSGVDGGIMASVPSRMGIGAFSPALDPKGNSLAGVKALELLSSKIGLSIF